MTYIAIVSIALLAILRQNLQWWDIRGSVVFGLVPIRLAWRAFTRLASGGAGLLAITLCRPGSPNHETFEKLFPVKLA